MHKKRYRRLALLDKLRMAAEEHLAKGCTAPRAEVLDWALDYSRSACPTTTAEFEGLLSMTLEEILFGSDSEGEAS